MKQAIKKLHLYFGLISGIFVVLIALSGTIYIFNDEIIYFANKEVLTVQPSEKPKLEVDQLLQLVKEQNYEPIQFIYSKESDRIFYVLAKNLNDQFVQIYINPYSGEFLKTSGLYNFFNFIEEFHTELCLGASGRTFIGIITILFFILLITGVVLWYPRKWNDKTIKNYFTMKFRGNRTVINYNLHKILGFYIVIPAITLSITGTIMAFDPLEIGMLKVIKSDGNYESYIDNLASQDMPNSATPISYQELVVKESSKKYKATELRITIPETKNAQFILCESGDNFVMKYADNYSFKYIDRLGNQPFILPGDTNQALNIKKDISQLHTGKMIGLPYKIILFIAGIIMTSLPITGFIIWYKKSYKRKKYQQA